MYRHTCNIIYKYIWKKIQQFLVIQKRAVIESLWKKKKNELATIQGKRKGVPSSPTPKQLWQEVTPSGRSHGDGEVPSL